MPFAPHNTSSRPKTLARKVLLAAVVAVIGVGAAAEATPVAAQTVAHTASGNPLRGTWGVYRSDTQDNPVYQAYLNSSGLRHALLARVARRSRVQWFGAWQSTSRIKLLVQHYIQDINANQPGAIAMMTAFGIPKWESQPQSVRNWTSSEVAAYHRWVDAFAAGIGRSRVALILQPDLLYVINNDHPAVPLGMVRYAAQKFGSLPNTTVYLDAGASDWRTPLKRPLVPILRAAGIQYTRGFALNDTHHDSITNELLYGAKVAKNLAAVHLPNHFVVNTADNGRPFLQTQLNSNNDPRECSNATMHPCVTLGIPATWDVTNPRWKLGPGARGAAKNADGYVWMGRPWLVNQNKGGQFALGRTLNMARTTPFK